MKLRPCIDLHGGKVKQIVGGTLTDKSKNSQGGAKENYVSSYPAEYYAQLYKKNNLTGGHVIKLGPDNDAQALSALGAWPGGLQIGGGITHENAAYWLRSGASHIIVTSYIFNNGQLDMDRLEKLYKEVGRENLVLDLSCRKRDNKWVVVTDRWQTFTSFNLTGNSLKDLSSYCDEFLIHGVDVEGKKCGIEEELVQLLGAETTIPVTYAGGVASFEDVDLIEKMGRGKVDYTVGSALDLFGGNLSFDKLLKRQ